MYSLTTTESNQKWEIFKRYQENGSGAIEHAGKKHKAYPKPHTLYKNPLQNGENLQDVGLDRVLRLDTK